MRKPLLSLAAVALATVACSGGSSPYSGGAGARVAPQPPAHHQPTYPPDPGRPAATPYGGVTYQDPGVNPYVDPVEDGTSTFGLDVDTASFTIAQRYAQDGRLPDPASVRVEEWVNAFEQGYPQPVEGTFGIVADGGPTPFLRPDELLLRVGLQARDVRDRARQQASLTFVIDTSGSMGTGARLEMVKDALARLVEGLRTDDRVAIVTFGSDAGILLEPTPASEHRAIITAIDRLEPGGTTNLEAGLRLGYELARSSLTEDGIDRVVLASDGVANVGLTDPDGILESIQRDASAGIELVSVGVGMGNYNDALLERLADQGDGFYAYINDQGEARRLFTEDLTGTLQTVALDAKAQVEFNAASVASYRLLGYENRAIDDRDFTDDTVAAGAIGAGHTVTALYAVRLREDADPQDRLATVRVRWTDPDRGGADEVSRTVRASDLSRSFGSTDPFFRFDAVVAATAETLRGSPYRPDLRLGDIAELASTEAEALPPSDAVHGFLDLLDRLARIEP